MILKLNDALEIARKYQQRYHIGGKLDIEQVLYYSDFYEVNGPAWIFVTNLPPSTFEGDDTITFVVDINNRRVHHIINSSGFIKYPHLDESESG